MDFMIESMQLPVDNLVGILLYAIIFMIVAGIIPVLALTFIPNRLPYTLKSAIVGTIVIISLLLWWNMIVT
ncbi:hypothetical protein [Aquibacillus saliphilus]|uniref:hypothetical protein n=1 Tax=Aquibacillus saliphilus TaxID=1909422 RepID=UPI001CF07AB5|nr:hypothetical protein [Aquibacillus saliphilus]